MVSLLFLAVCTLLLIITADSKMIMYVNNYGLTTLRVYTSWFMLLLCILTLFIILKLILPIFNFYKFAAVAAISLYLALNVINVDSLIAGYNINLYHQTGKLDIQVFNNLSDSAVSEIATLRNDEKYGSDIQKFLNARKSHLSLKYWQNFSFAEQSANQSLNQ